MENINVCFVSTNYGNNVKDKSYKNIKMDSIKFKTDFKGNKKMPDKYIIKKDTRIFDE